MDKREIEIIMQMPKIMSLVRRKLMNGFRSREGLALSLTQDRLLLCIFDHNLVTMTELHMMTGLEKGSLTTIVDQLIEKGLVQRARDKGDRRKVFVSLTEAGQKQGAVRKEEIARFIQSRLKNLSAIQREEFTKAIKTIVELFEHL